MALPILLKHGSIITKSLSMGNQKAIFMPLRRYLTAFPKPSLKESIMTNLTNKIVLVTGASRGMGRATAIALAAAGARVIVHYGRNADEAKAVVDQIHAAGGRADAIATDLAAP